MNLQKAPALFLAAVLQIIPLCRVACVNQAVAPTGFAIVMRWAAGAVALLGSYHAVSGASAAVPGVIPINPVTQFQTGPVTLNAVGTNGQTIAYRIYVTNPGINPQQAYYNAIGLPPGLTLNTNLGGNGDILGTPTAPGVYFPVTVIAGNANYVGTVSTNITITITSTGASPPAITTPPKNQTIAVGSNVTFTVTATGTGPLRYQWLKASSPLLSATNSSYTITAAQTNDSGGYSVRITNSAGSITSTVATLSVLSPPSISTPPQALTTNAGATVSFTVAAQGSPTLAYSWRLNGAALSGATSSILMLTNVQTANQGDYSVVVTSLVGSVTSASAHLTVQSQTIAPPQLANWQVANGLVSFDVTSSSQTNVVIWESADLNHWTAVRTNFSSTGTVRISETQGSNAVQFYRASVAP
jgi:hypothetical protein